MTSKHKQVPQLHTFLNTLQHTIHPDTAVSWHPRARRPPKASPKRTFRGGGEIRVNSPGAASRPAAATPGTAPPPSPPPVCQCCRADRARTARSNISAHCRSGKWRSLRCPRRIPDPSLSASSRRRGVQTYGLSVALWRREARPLCGALVQAHINTRARAVNSDEDLLNLSQFHIRPHRGATQPHKTFTAHNRLNI